MKVLHEPSFRHVDPVSHQGIRAAVRIFSRVWFYLFGYAGKGLVDGLVPKPPVCKKEVYYFDLSGDRSSPAPALRIGGDKKGIVPERITRIGDGRSLTDQRSSGRGSGSGRDTRGASGGTCIPLPAAAGPEEEQDKACTKKPQGHPRHPCKESVISVGQHIIHVYYYLLLI
jgi:hypothetical protein